MSTNPLPGYDEKPERDPAFVTIPPDEPLTEELFCLLLAAYHSALYVHCEVKP